MNPDAVHETMFLCGGTASARQTAQKRQRDSDDGANSIRSSPGARFRRYTTLRACLSSTMIDLVQRRIASAGIDKILMGHAMGREIAWVKKTHDQLRTSGDEKPASMLAEHYDFCRCPRPPWSSRSRICRTLASPCHKPSNQRSSSAL